MKRLVTALSCCFFVYTAFANNIGVSSTSTYKWCCAIQKVSLHSVFDDEDFGKSQHSTDDCTKGSQGGANRAAAPNALSSGTYYYVHDTSDGTYYDVGVKCNQIVVHRHCEYAPKDSAICKADESNDPGVNGGINPDS